MTHFRAIRPRFCSVLLMTALAAFNVHCGGDSGGGGVTPPDDPSIELSSTAVSFNGTAGEAASAPQSVEIANRGGGTLSELAIEISYTAGQPTGWLSGTLSQTEAPSTLILIADPASIPEGTYTATIAVSSGTADNSPQTVGVTFTVTPSAAAGSVIALSSNSQTFSAQQGGANPPPQTVQVANAGGGTLNGLAAGVSYAAGQPTGWLAATLSSLEVPSAVTLAATTGSLTAGTYTASVAVTSPVATNSPQTVNVTFTVAASGGAGPAIAVSPSSRSFTAPEGGANPASQTVQVTNSGGGTLNGLAATVSYTSGQPTGWLGVNLSSTSAPSALTLAATTGSLTEGTYTANVAVTSAAASNSPQMVAVTFVVQPPAGGTPSIALSPPNVTLRVPEGTVNPAAGTVTVTNGGSGTLSGLAVGTVTYGPGAANWLDLELSGTVAPATLRLGVTAASLVAGTYTATVPITSSLPGVSPQSVGVSFDVTSTSPAVGILAASLTASAGGIASAPSKLYVVEVAENGQDLLRGTIAMLNGFQPVIVDLALKPGGLYGISFTTLYLIDQSGQTDEIGSLGLSENANALAFDGNGKLYGATTGGNLFTVNIPTFEATVIGSYGPDLQSDGDIAFAPDGTLYGAAVRAGTSVLVSIDPASGQATPIGTSLGYNNVWGMTYFGGKLYGLTSDPGAAAGVLVEIDVTTGVATKVRDLSFDTGGAGSARP